MTRLILPLLVLAPVMTACAPDTRMPESGYQWQQRQERIEREWRAAQTQVPAQTPTKTRAVAPAQTSTNGAPAPEDRS
ncbi:hypothetical protein [Brevundimonas sp.]|jgi:hypothetical protein|uniref:hypothetical protein n=1 Tax=Brevundimonas sp. TaxID=1871086 RepID=UPI001A2AEAF1|nr:hypothetical protein [Brevundimonas sp.]MBJ7511812.1 hypothetical protein [Brevundimonas sp.]